LLIDVLIRLGIVPGIKVDLGLNRLPFTGQHGCDEAVTKGLDNLAERCAKYYQQGARFAKWRAVIRINNQQGQHTHDMHPSDVAIETNMCNLAQYAVICQANGLVPILEPEVLMDGDHTLEECAHVTEKVLSALYSACYKHKVSECFKMFQNVSKCSKMFQNVSKCSKMFQNVPRCFKMFQNVPKCFKMFQNVSNVSKCSKMFQNVPKCFKCFKMFQMFQNVSKCFKMFQQVVLEASVLKPNMALGGQDCPDSYTTDEIAATTVRMLQVRIVLGIEMPYCTLYTR
jgi:fructose-bisphosphate aldolase class 1